MRLFIIISLLFLINPVILFAQTRQEIIEIKNNMVIPAPNKPKIGIPENKINKPLVFFYIFYKKYISSQDAVKCAFTPSCSEYSIQTIQQNGLIKGLFDTFDRLSRCHTFSHQNYQFDRDLKLLIDPVK